MAMLRNKRRRRARTEAKSHGDNSSPNPIDPTESDEEERGFDTNKTFKKLLLKLFTYAAIFFFLRRFGKKGKDAQEASPVTEETLINHRELNAGSGAVYVVKDFLPQEVAIRWRNHLSYEWNKMGQLGESVAGAWHFATSNDVEGSTTFKVVNLNDVSERNSTAHKIYQEGFPSYSNWELDTLHPSLVEIKETFLNEKVQNKVKKVTGIGASAALTFSPNFVDLSVMHFSTGNFHSLQNETFPGSWSFILSLMEVPKRGYIESELDEEFGEKGEWKEEFGGLIRFNCPQSSGPKSQGNVQEPMKWCETVLPAFNEALIFKKPPKGPHVDMLPVSWQAEKDGFRNFMVTGSYVEKSGILNEKRDGEL